MSLNYAPSEVSAETYQRIFDLERQQSYPMVDAFEARMGHAMDREQLEAYARVLSCPYKAVPPNWQHGRVIFAATREYTTRMADQIGLEPFNLLDIGTAKGYSAMCLSAGVADECAYVVTSVDVLPPNERVRRNTVAEVDGLKTLAETQAEFPEAQRINFLNCTGIEYLSKHPERIHVAFVDGKHSGVVVRQEGLLLADRQERGDVAIFDDVHIPDVGAAVDSLKRDYDIERLQILPKRAYAIARRK